MRTRDVDGSRDGLYGVPPFRQDALYLQWSSWSTGFYFVTDGNIYTWNDVSELAMQCLKVKVRVFTLSEKALKRAAMLTEAVAGLTRQTPLLDRQRVLDICQSSWVASPQKFFDRFDFQPQFDLARGLPHTLEWYQQQKWL